MDKAERKREMIKRIRRQQFKSRRIRSFFDGWWKSNQEE